MADQNTGVERERMGTRIDEEINQWAAETYPIAQKHLDTAGTLENERDKRLDQLQAAMNTFRRCAERLRDLHEEGGQLREGRAVDSARDH